MTPTDHPLTETRAVELWNASLPATSWETAWILRPLGDRDRTHPLLAPLRTAYDAGREDALKHADPRHDARYVPCGPDFHYQEPGGRRGIWDRQTGEVAWFSSSEDSSAFLTRLAERIDMGVDSRGEWAWSPAATPPAEEVKLPTEFGAVITDVEADFGETIRFDRMVWTGWRWTYRDYSTTSGFIHAFTLPDGTRARRDGDRFIKVQEEEK